MTATLTDFATAPDFVKCLADQRAQVEASYNTR
jgi:hypothetical protein